MPILSDDDKVYVAAGSIGFPESETLDVETIHDGKKIRKTAQLTVIHHNSGEVGYQLTIDEHKFEKDGTSNRMSHIPLNEASTEKLFRYLLTRDQFASLAQTTLYTLVESIAPLDKVTIERLAVYLRRASKHHQISSILPDDLVSNFSAVVHQIRYRKATEELELLMSETHSENEYQEWFLKNPWVFGTEYLTTEDVKIGWRTSGDIILTSVDGYQDIVELKLPSEEIFIYDKSHDNWYPTSALSKAISQAIKYIQESEDGRMIIESKEGVPFLRPRAKVVIGRSVDWDKDKRMDCLQKLNSQLHNIQVMTYDHLLLMAKRMIKYYEGG